MSEGIVSRLCMCQPLAVDSFFVEKRITKFRKLILLSGEQNPFHEEHILYCGWTLNDRRGDIFVPTYI